MKKIKKLEYLEKDKRGRISTDSMIQIAEKQNEIIEILNILLDIQDPIIKKGVGKIIHFRELLEDPEARELIDQIEWGSSDKELVESWKKELFEKTGWRWQDNFRSKDNDEQRRD